MKPTESAKIRELGKITSKQRLMEVFEFLENKNSYNDFTNS